MRIYNINYTGIVALFLFSILFVSCKDENKNDTPKIQLDVSEIIVEEGEAVVVTVSGVESFTASIAPENIASAGVSGNVIRVKGIQAGKGTLTVTSGEYTVSCPVTVSGDFYKDTDVRGKMTLYILKKKRDILSRGRKVLMHWVWQRVGRLFGTMLR